jgi:hypothetical protein
MSDLRPRAREEAPLYDAILALRARGFRIQRMPERDAARQGCAGGALHRLNRSFVTSAELIALANAGGQS